MVINIDTTSQLYQKYVDGIDAIRSFYTPKLLIFKDLPLSKQKAWLKRDPLLKKIFKLSLDLSEFIMMIGGELDNDL